MAKSWELTLSLLKPHLTKNPLATKNVKKRIREEGFVFVDSKIIQLSKVQAESFYSEHRDKFFFNRLIIFICSGPIQAYILGREDAIQKWRSIIGPTRVYQALYSDPCSIRGMYGLSDTRNAAHGSDSKDSARREIKIIFPDFRFDEWEGYK